MMRLLSNMGSALQNTLHIMTASRWDDFFARLNEPERITADWIRDNRALEMQLMMLVGTVSQVEQQHTDASKPFNDSVANNFDRAIFSIGQVCAHQPAEISKLRCAAELVRALGIGLKYGWTAHCGIGKFAANSLVMLATARDAVRPVRAASFRLLMVYLSRWLASVELHADSASASASGGARRLQEVYPAADSAAGDNGEDVCGCSCTTPSASATCWVERLLANQDNLIDSLILLVRTPECNRSGGGIDRPEWVCSSCKLRNSGSSMRCAMCGQRKDGRDNGGGADGAVATDERARSGTDADADGGGGQGDARPRDDDESVRGGGSLSNKAAKSSASAQARQRAKQRKDEQREHDVRRLAADCAEIGDTTQMPTVEVFVRQVMRVVRNQRGNPFALTHLMQVPGVAGRVLGAGPDCFDDTFALVEPLCEGTAELEAMRARVVAQIESKAVGCELPRLFRPDDVVVDGGSDAEAHVSRGGLAESVLCCLTYMLLALGDPFFGEQAMLAITKVAEAEAEAEIAATAAAKASSVAHSAAQAASRTSDVAFSCCSFCGQGPTGDAIKTKPPLLESYRKRRRSRFAAAARLRRAAANANDWQAHGVQIRRRRSSRPSLRLHRFLSFGASLTLLEALASAACEQPAAIVLLELLVEADAAAIALRALVKALSASRDGDTETEEQVRKQEVVRAPALRSLTSVSELKLADAPIAEVEAYDGPAATEAAAFAAASAAIENTNERLGTESKDAENVTESKDDDDGASAAKYSSENESASDDDELSWSKWKLRLRRSLTSGDSELSRDTSPVPTVLSFASRYREQIRSSSTGPSIACDTANTEASCGQNDSDSVVGDTLGEHDDELDLSDTLCATCGSWGRCCECGNTNAEVLEFVIPKVGGLIGVGLEEWVTEQSVPTTGISGVLHGDAAATSAKGSYQITAREVSIGSLLPAHVSGNGAMIGSPGPAAVAGVRVGDIVLAVDGVLTQTPAPGEDEANASLVADADSLPDTPALGVALDRVAGRIEKGGPNISLRVLRDSTTYPARAALQDTAEGGLPWPREQKVKIDTAKAWALLEIIGPGPGEEEALLARMSLAEKRVWLNRALFRYHRMLWMEPPIQAAPPHTTSTEQADHGVQTAEAEVMQASRDGSDGVAEHEDEGGWVCAACTFINAEARVTCEMCDNPRILGTDPNDRVVITQNAAAAAEAEAAVMNEAGQIEREEPLSFIEWDRSRPVLEQLREQQDNGTGLSDNCSGVLEVRFVGESSTGSAVMREWFGVVSEGILHEASGAAAAADGGTSAASDAGSGNSAAKHKRKAKKQKHTELNLLVSRDGRRTFLPSPSSGATNSRHVRDFEILGRFVGLAVQRQVVIGLPFHPAFCRLLLSGNQPYKWSMDDNIKELDPLFYQHKAMALLKTPLADLGLDGALDFTDALDDRGADEMMSLLSGSASTDTEVPAANAAAALNATVPEGDDAANALDKGATTVREQEQKLKRVAAQRIDLKDGGADIEVTDENKEEYVRLACEYRLFRSIHQQTEAFLRGFHSMVPPNLMTRLESMVSAPDFGCLIAGMPHIDVDDWEEHTDYVGGFKASSRTIRHFWRVVRDKLSADEREALLQFATGSRRPPAGGFGRLQGFNGGVHPFTIAKAHERRSGSRGADAGTSGEEKELARLPTAHACICTVDLPVYESVEQMTFALRAAITNGCMGFDEAVAAEDLDSDADADADAAAGDDG